MNGKKPLLHRSKKIKNKNKQILSSYQPVSLLPVCTKIFEHLIYKSMYQHISDNNLLSHNQSGFRTRAIFLDISKAFHKVWRKGLIYKLFQYGFTGNLLDLLTDFLSNRKQRIVFNGQHSSWVDIKAGVPQGSIVRPLLFLVYINYLPENLHSSPKLFADDTSYFSTGTDEAFSHSYLK